MITQKTYISKNKCIYLEDISSDLYGIINMIVHHHKKNKDTPWLTKIICVKDRDLPKDFIENYNLIEV